MNKLLYVIIPVLLIIMLTSVSYADTLGSPSFVNAFVHSSSSIRVNWDNNVSGATRYVLQRKMDDGSFSTIANLPPNTSSYKDSNISNGHSYIYRVYATKGGESGSAQESYPVEYLLPSGLSIKAISDTETQLVWSYPFGNKIPDTNYQTAIERREQGSNTWQTVETVPGTENTYIDTALSEGNRYYYRIRAITSISAIYLYYPTSTTGQYVSTLLSAPINLTTQVTSTSTIKISWDDVSSKETGYRIERKKGNGNFVRIGSTLANETSYIDKTVENGQQYTYRVTALSSSYHGTTSQEVTVPFLFPVSFTIHEPYSTQLTMSWEYPGSGYISADNSIVMIERRLAGSTEWKQIHTTRPGETEFTDNNLEPGTRYYYRIRSRYDYGFTTDYFPSASGKSEYTKLLFDTHFYARAISDTEILIEWSDKAIENYTVILEKLDDSGVFKPLTSLSKRSFYIDTVSPGSINGYRIKIRTNYIDSDYTEEVYVSTEQIPAVRNLAIKSIVPKRVFITWEYDSRAETGFEVWRMAQSEGIWRHIDTTRSGQFMFSDENALNGETYTYKVRAIKNNMIFSNFSSTNPIIISFTRHEGELVVSQLDDMLYLGWDDFSDMEEYYAIEYKTSINDIWHSLTKVPKDITMYRFVPEEGIDYTLRVRAYCEYPVYETYTNEVFFTTKTPTTPSLSFPSVVGSKRIVLSWIDLSDNEDEFLIYRRSNIYENDFILAGKVDRNVTTYADRNVVPNHSYSYIVKAKNAAGESFGSNEIVVKTPLITVFNDIPSNFDWATDSIYSLTSKGIINGDGQGNFNPAGNITRAEFIKLLVATFALPETPIGSFKDVAPTDWYHRYIMTAYHQEIIEPDGSGMFYPDAPITRQDIVYYSARAIKCVGLSLDQPPLYTLYKFTDYNEMAPYAQSSFASMHYAGIINGIGNNKLGPENPANRAEAATIVYRMIKALEP
ncbi:MAG TPA: S-layer homology domain-containing protein [Thermoclostridium sp.]|nr:S-layer homology domain-containing protein [Thermoclostridium sp.]